MQVTFDPLNITAEERDVLLALLEQQPAAPAAKAAAPAKKAPAKKAAEPEPEPEPVAEEPEDLLGGGTEVTVDDALAAASKLVSDGKAAEVKAALEAVGAKRVSEVPQDKLAEFVGLLG
jgi:hypothetical protein